MLPDTIEVELTVYTGTASFEDHLTVSPSTYSLASEINALSIGVCVYERLLFVYLLPAVRFSFN